MRGNRISSLITGKVSQILSSVISPPPSILLSSPFPDVTTHGSGVGHLLAYGFPQMECWELMYWENIFEGDSGSVINSSSDCTELPGDGDISE